MEMDGNAISDGGSIRVSNGSRRTSSSGSLSGSRRGSLSGNRRGSQTRDFEGNLLTQLEEAKAKMVEANAALEKAEAEVLEAKAEVTKAEAKLEKAEAAAEAARVTAAEMAKTGGATFEQSERRICWASFDKPADGLTALVEAVEDSLALEERDPMDVVISNANQPHGDGDGNGGKGGQGGSGGGNGGGGNGDSSRRSPISNRLCGGLFVTPRTYQGGNGPANNVADMADFYDQMTAEEIEDYEMRQYWRNVQNAVSADTLDILKQGLQDMIAAGTVEIDKTPAIFTVNMSDEEVSRAREAIVWPSSPFQGIVDDDDDDKFEAGKGQADRSPSSPSASGDGPLQPTLPDTFSGADCRNSDSGLDRLDVSLTTLTSLSENESEGCHSVEAGVES
ncbi:hypothetical protein HK405_012041, partial [Cladochytrium tenue]